jgi:mono/diheme cytochrome c family protein
MKAISFAGALTLASVALAGDAVGRSSCAVCHGANSGLKSVEDFHGMR